MWMFTPIGFFSIVQKPGDKAAGRLTVRARVAADLDALRAQYLPELGPTTSHAGTDYAHRATAPRAAVAAAMARIAGSIDYPNFKDQVAALQGRERAHVYAEVWSALWHGLHDPSAAVKVWHPRLNERGKPVEILHPSQPTPLAAWATGLATVVPDGPLPAALLGVAFAPWTDAPSTAAQWNALADAHALQEPAFQARAGFKNAAGVVVMEQDGRVWIVHPSNQFGGYVATFPKGTAEPGLSLQACALKECCEESGLRVVLQSHLVDCDRSASRTRYYLARRVGGSPAAMGWESQAVSLVPVHALASLVTSRYDRPVIDAVLARLAAG